MAKPNPSPKSALSEQEGLSSCELDCPHVFEHYHFAFQTLEEAKHLAGLLSSLYPHFHQKHAELGLNEVFINAIEHGNLGFSFEEKAVLKQLNRWHDEVHQRLNHEQFKDNLVHVTVEISPSDISVTVKDQGEGFDWRKVMKQIESSKLAPNGRGLKLAKELCFHDLQFSEKGNEVKCLFYK